MANTTSSRLGASLGATAPFDHADNQELMLKVFSGEVLEVFDRKQVLKDLVKTRRLTGAKEAQFPIIGTASAGYHAPGQDISASTGNGGLMQEIQHAEKIVKVDYPLVAPVFISEWDEALNHYEVRSEYAHQLGQALANKWDKLLFRVFDAAGSGSASVPGTYAGHTITNSDATGYSTADFLAHIFEAKQKMDERDVPMEGRVLCVPPAWEIALIKDDAANKLIDRDYSIDNGSYARAVIGRVAGFTLITSNNMPFEDSGEEPGAESGQLNGSYQGDTAIKMEALAFHPDAVGQVTLWDMEVQTQYSALHQGTFVMSRLACGADVLRNECAIPIVSTAASKNVPGPN